MAVDTAMPVEKQAAMDAISSEELHRGLSTQHTLSSDSANMPNSVKDRILLDWDSPEDVGNPKNWTVGKKIFHTAIPAFYGFTV